MGPVSQTPDFLPVSESENGVSTLPPSVSDERTRGDNSVYIGAQTQTHNGIPHTNSSGSLSSVGPATTLNHTAHSEEEFRHLLGLSYPLYNANGSVSGPYAYVDPSQILGYSQGNEGFLMHNLQASPVSDPTTGFSSSATASPEPGTSDSGSKQRKVISIKRSTQVNLSHPNTSPDMANDESLVKPQEGDGSVEAANEITRTDDSNKETLVTLCSNCHTTNTPLWRRDAEGKPLCEFYPALIRECLALTLLT